MSQLFKQRPVPEENKKKQGPTIQQVQVKPIDDILEKLDEEIEQKKKQTKREKDACGCW